VAAPDSSHRGSATIADTLEAASRGKDLAGLLGGGGLAGLVVLGAGDLASYVFSRVPAVLLPIFAVAVLITGCLIGLAYSNFDAHARMMQRVLDTGTLTPEDPAPTLDRLRRATALRWASMVSLIVTALILVTACCFVWLDPR